MYLGIYEGKITRRLKEPEEGSVTRVNKNGNTVHELHFDAWEGKVKRIYVKPPPQDHPNIGASLAIILEDEEGVKAQIETSLTGGYSADIIKRLCACDLHQNIVFNPFKFKDKNDKIRMGMSLQQFGAKVENMFTKERTPNMPAWKEVVYNGQKLYDKTDQLRYLLTALRRKVTKDGPAVLDLEAQYTADGVAIKSDYVDLNAQGDAIKQMQAATPPPQSQAPMHASHIPNTAVPASALPPAQPAGSFGGAQAPAPQTNSFGPPTGLSNDAEDDLPF